MMSGAISYGRIDGALDIPLNRRTLRKPPLPCRVERVNERLDDDILVGQQMNGWPEMRLLVTQAREPWHIAQRQIELEGRSWLPVAVDASVVRLRKMLGADEVAHAERVRIDHDRRRVDFIARIGDDAAHDSTVDENPRHTAMGLDGGAVAARGLRKAGADDAHPALDQHPRAGGAVQPAHVVNKEIHAGSWCIP